jgi:hypothetical protein
MAKTVECENFKTFVMDVIGLDVLDAFIFI